MGEVRGGGAGAESVASKKQREKVVVGSVLTLSKYSTNEVLIMQSPYLSFTAFHIFQEQTSWALNILQYMWSGHSTTYWIIQVYFV